MTVFSDKLVRLSETLALVIERGLEDLAAALESGRDRFTYAIGSGGSAVAVEYLAHCRATLGLGNTATLTPMEFVVGMETYADCDIWLFSAGADNPDIAAAFTVATASKANRIWLVTVNDTGSTALAVKSSGGRVVALPVADPKDGFLATHSMISAIAALLLASDRLAGSEVAGRLLGLTARAAEALGPSSAGSLAAAKFKPGDTVVVLHDPRLAPVAVLIETCLWETGIAAVQRTDFRNFAHGRHVWAARHPDRLLILALTSEDSLGAWSGIADNLPPDIRRQDILLGDAGRMQNAIGIFHGLALVRALGERAGIDPGRPGRGPFAEAIYGDRSLEILAKGLTPAIRHKTAARRLYDPDEVPTQSVNATARSRLASLDTTVFTGLVLDYDGTIVATSDRYEPPAADILTEILRLVDAGVPFGVATGRGGSAGEMLRMALPERIHHQVLMGYYNGGHIRALDVDIRNEPASVDDDIQKLSDWLRSTELILPGAPIEGLRQLTIDHSRISNPAAFYSRLMRYPAVVDGRLHVSGSQHSFDVFPKTSSKLRLVEALSVGPTSGRAVLTVGDSGAPSGNDYEMLAGPYGVSVGTVCGSLVGCWSLFGDEITGPGALLRLLKAVTPVPGGFRLSLTAMGLDAAG